MAWQQLLVCGEARSFAGFVSAEIYSYDSQSTTLIEAVSKRHSLSVAINIFDTVASSTTGDDM